MNEHSNSENDEQLTAELLRAAATPKSMPDAMKNRLAASFAEQMTQQSKERERQLSVRRRLLVCVPVAASVMFALLFWPASQITPELKPHSVVTEIAGVAQAIGADTTRPLRSGGTVYIGEQIHTGENSLLALQYGEHHLRINRNTQLETLSGGMKLKIGEIYVDDVSSSGLGSTSIDIVTPHGIISDVGTQFMVASSAQKTVAIVRDGIIQVQRQAQITTAAATDSEAQRLVLTEAHVLQEVAERFGAQWDWIQKLPSSYPLNGHSVADYLNWIARETGYRIEYETEQLRGTAEKIKLSGELSGAHPLDTLPKVLATTRLQHPISENGRILIRSRK